MNSLVAVATTTSKTVFVSIRLFCHHLHFASISLSLSLTLLGIEKHPLWRKVRFASSDNLLDAAATITLYMATSFHFYFRKTKPKRIHSFQSSRVLLYSPLKVVIAQYRCCCLYLGDINRLLALLQANSMKTVAKRSDERRQTPNLIGSCSMN